MIQLWKKFRGDDKPPAHLGSSKDYNIDMNPMDVGYGKGTAKSLLDKIAEVEVRHKIPLCLAYRSYQMSISRKHCQCLLTQSAANTTRLHLQYIS
ncbi:hypothetical protein P8452_45791 [Trifolium repens]|nr:hypothetical protein P8452_45791 [Trifolium repens]